MGSKRIRHHLKLVERELIKEKNNSAKLERYLKIILTSLIVAVIVTFIAIGSRSAIAYLSEDAKSTNNFHDPGEAILEVNGINSNGPVSSSRQGDYEFISLFAPAQYTVTMSALGDNCSYHQSGTKKGDSAIHGTQSQQVEVAGGEKSLVYALACTSPNGFWRTQKMVIVNVLAPPETQTSVLSTTAQ